eukprot:3940376-Rhodomonas_salina.2
MPGTELAYAPTRPLGQSPFSCPTLSHASVCSYADAVCSYTATPYAPTPNVHAPTLTRYGATAYRGVRLPTRWYTHPLCSLLRYATKSFIICSYAIFLRISCYAPTPRCCLLCAMPLWPCAMKLRRLMLCAYTLATRCPAYRLGRYEPAMLSAYAMPGTDTAYAATQLGVLVNVDTSVWCYAVCGTERAYGATRCVVLSERMVLRQWMGRDADSWTVTLPVNITVSDSARAGAVR